MLKRLDLVGFKSFADKTSFEFGDGITAVVGPNGSGKSNIVDAVRWIMGEQSAKSLRGGEMADVIFNGSTARRSLGLAEVTMTFDNRRRQLATETEEVQITRRVYRSGEGEYLINGQVCRLRDIKDMFLGSGAGHDAYCIIEQGKVDTLLQASTKERRALFEESAGISRFRARKMETLRKLERVDQNMQRLKDIVDEVEKQLRSVKLQAGKAQRYHEYSTRLKELRLELGLREYRQFTEQFQAETSTLDGMKVELDQRAGRAVACEAETERLEILVEDLDDEIHKQEGLQATAQQQIRAAETTIGHETALSADLDKELDRTRRRLTELAERVSVLAQSAERSEADLVGVREQTDRQRQAVAALDAQFNETVTQIKGLQAQTSADKNEHLEQMRRSARLQNEAVAGKAQVDNLARERDRLRHKTAQAAENLAAADRDLQELTAADDELQGRLARLRLDQSEKREEAERLRQLRDRTSEQLSVLRQERSGLASRIEVLQRLEDNHEGLGTGVREMLALLEHPEPGPWSGVLGMIADFLTVKREWAPLIDLALGDWAQRFLVRDLDQLVAALAQMSEPFSGRVSFLPLSCAKAKVEDSPAFAALRANGEVEVALLSQVRAGSVSDGQQTTDAVRAGSVSDGQQTTDAVRAGSVSDGQQTTDAVNDEVVARGPSLTLPARTDCSSAEQVVSCEDPELAELPARLLGRTLIVHDLAAARAIAEHTPGFRLITLQGELLEADGTLTVGSQRGEMGILSRKSELFDLKEQASQLDLRLVDIDHDLAELREHGDRLEQEIAQRQNEIDGLAGQGAELHNRLERRREQRQALHEEVRLSQEEIARLDEEIVVLDAAWQEARTLAAQAETQVQVLQARLHQTEESVRRLEQERQQRQEALTTGQVALGKAEERLEGLLARHQQLTRDLEQRQREQQQGRQTLISGRARLVMSQQAMLDASALLAQLYLDKEDAQRRLSEMTTQRDVRRQDRVRLTQQAQTLRNEWRAQQELAHACELRAKDLQHQRDTLIDRLREDYQVDLAELAACGLAPGKEEASAKPQAAAEDEIADLRQKLTRLGSVNMEALHELQDLETRSTELQAQWQDVTSAKKSLEEIIAKINQDSRKLFAETFAVIRTHFQELFRKLFGGGMADIVLEDETDILESGIEIIAKPPGKELRSISLMSGGEKTLTAVALLLAVFRSKPSPFCVLDEVDAALDEANIGRFTDVIREFLDMSQFILVTHSKKTMSCADVLYGITMQESGVSKQVAVRFEDWVDEEAPATAETPANGNGKVESFAGR